MAFEVEARQYTNYPSNRLASRQLFPKVREFFETDIQFRHIMIVEFTGSSQGTSSFFVKIYCKDEVNNKLILFGEYFNGQQNLYRAKYKENPNCFGVPGEGDGGQPVEGLYDINYDEIYE